MRTLFIFRHGETDWNKEGRFQGRFDIPLNETGRKQAERLREFFSLNPVEVFLSSDLARARETAEIAKGELDVPVVLESRLRETNLGDAEGLTQEEVAVKFGPELLQGWRSIGLENQNFRFPNGESKAEHLERILAGLEQFLGSTEYSRIAVASHGGVMRRLLHHLLPGLSTPVMVGNCVIYRVDFYEDGSRWVVHPEPL